MILKLFNEKGDENIWYENFIECHNDHFSNSSIKEWQLYVDNLLGKTATFNYSNTKYPGEYIEFESEEDYVQFLLKWG